MNNKRISAVIALCAVLLGEQSFAENLPICSNRIINEVTSRTGCTVGDAKCWLTRGGFCMDYVEKRLRQGKSAKKLQLKPVAASQVKKGDVAVFVSRAHYAYVENVVRNAAGAPVAVDLTEYNFGKCLVDEQVMVTDTYLKETKRQGVPLSMVDGGFLRK